jgi:hypothetical protein
MSIALIEAAWTDADPVFHNMMKSSIVHYGMLLSFTFPMGSMLWILPFWVLDRVST